MESHEVLSTSGLGFRFVRWFLFIILFGVACMAGLALLLGPYVPKVIGDIQFHSVTFGYEPHQAVLHQINLTIPAQTTVALVGKSGSGKSTGTLAELIPRFYDPQEGQINIDKYDIRHVNLKSLRQQIGFAMQGSTLFQGSILDNLAFEREIPMRVIKEATQAAYIHDYIAALPEGYDTLVGEQGAQMSEGQKQRIALVPIDG